MSRWPDKQSISGTRTAACLVRCGMRAERRNDWMSPAPAEPMMRLPCPGAAGKGQTPQWCPRKPLQYCMAAILHCVNYSAQREHVCFGCFQHFVQSPAPNTLISLVDAVVSLVVRFVPAGGPLQSPMKNLLVDCFSPSPMVRRPRRSFVALQHFQVLSPTF